MAIKAKQFTYLLFKSHFWTRNVRKNLSQILIEYGPWSSPNIF